MASVETVATELHVDEDVQLSTSSFQNSAPLLIQSSNTLPNSSFLSRDFMSSLRDKAFTAAMSLDSTSFGKEITTLGGFRLGKKVCDVCGRQFKLSGHLNRHMKVHTGERPYACNHCSYRSSRNDSLRMHVLNRHTNVATDPLDI